MSEQAQNATPNPGEGYTLPADIAAMIEQGNAARAAHVDPSVLQEERADDKSYAIPKAPISEVERIALAKSQAMLASEAMRQRDPIEPTQMDRLIEHQRRRYGN